MPNAAAHPGLVRRGCPHHIDLISARSESITGPARCQKNLAHDDDLRRRDFTINTLAFA
jgi:tRNA nucleotidyltransferase/poly(A) polymerase